MGASGAGDYSSSQTGLQTGMGLNSNSDLSNQSSLLPSEPSRAWRWLWWGLAVCGIFGGTGTIALFWLTALPPATDCQKISGLSPDIDRLYCAQQAVRSGELSELLAGLALLEQWTPKHPLYQEAQRWLEDWSSSVLVIARERIRQNDFDGAVNLAKRVPQSSPKYGDAQAAIAEWRQEWNVGQTLYNEAQVALKQQDWEQVTDRILTLSEMNYGYWRVDRVNTLSQQIIAEKRARRSLAEAEQIARLDRPESLSQAINTVNKMNRQTYAWQEAQGNLKQWSQALLGFGFQHWQNREFDQAIALAKQATASSEVATDAEDLIQLSQARQLAIASDSSWQPTPKHVWNLMEAVSAIRNIKPNSKFYAQAQLSLQNWQSQLADLKQLQTAYMTASLKQPEALKLAIQQAEQIQPGRYRRRQAQTLIAYWSTQIQIIEDRPYLIYAQRMSQTGTIESFQAAISKASQIPQGRVLRTEAQSLIAGWTAQIQTLQDRPILIRAQTLADEGRLQEAIQVAAAIQEGRALYPEARRSIRSWYAQIREAQVQQNQIRQAPTQFVPAREPRRTRRSTPVPEQSTPLPDPAQIETERRTPREPRRVEPESPRIVKPRRLERPVRPVPLRPAPSETTPRPSLQTPRPVEVAPSPEFSSPQLEEAPRRVEEDAPVRPRIEPLPIRPQTGEPAPRLQPAPEPEAPPAAAEPAPPRLVEPPAPPQQQRAEPAPPQSRPEPPPRVEDPRPVEPPAPRVEEPPPAPMVEEAPAAPAAESPAQPTAVEVAPEPAAIAPAPPVVEETPQPVAIASPAVQAAAE
jgi:hypothetical protein